MAKRKRLSPPDLSALNTAQPLEAKSMFGAPPIADVAADAAGQAALNEMAQTLSDARTQGRMVLELGLDDIKVDYIERDRLVIDDADMEALCNSLRSRGQQTPIEVVELSDRPGHYGLISGWRRYHALKTLLEETGDARFGTVLGLVRQPKDTSDAYLAMVEENEIRANLSYFERARIAVHCVDQKVFETDKAALGQLYANASRARRSKIGAFMPIVRALRNVIKHPDAVSERLGLEISQAMRKDLGLSEKLRGALAGKSFSTAAAEQDALRKVLTAAKPKSEPNIKTSESILNVKGLNVSLRNGALTLKGAKLTPKLQADLVTWLRHQIGS